MTPASKESLTIIGGVIAIGLVAGLLGRADNKATPAPTPAAYVGERPPHPLDGKQGRNGTVEEIQQPDCLATYEKFRKLKSGQMKSHVARVMDGCEGELVSDSRIGGIRYTTVQWRGEGFSLMQVMFKDREILSLNQIGLR